MNTPLEKFNRFLKHRQSLLYQFKKGDLNKHEFIVENYNIIINLGINPFQKIDNLKKAVYNYQYYNVMAKYHQKLVHNFNKDDYGRRDIQDLVNDYYYMKDKVTMQLLKLIDYKDIEAYFVIVHSQALKGRLFEIVLKDEDLLLDLDHFSDFNNTMDCNYLIMHSTNTTILNLLKAEGVFKKDKKKSLTDSYINQKY